MKLKRYNGEPIISPNPRNVWESLATFNPAAWYDEHTNEVKLLYRASGHDDEYRVHFGMATSKNGYDFERVSDQPVFVPSADGIDAGVVEDPRVVKMGDYYYITYAVRPFPPGQYWLSPEKRPYNPPQCPVDFPKLFRENATSTCLAITKDFKNFIRAGRLTRCDVDDRDVILFPEKIDGKYYMIHRPMEWCGNGYGTEHPAIWIASSDDLLCFNINQSQLLAKAEFDWEYKVGANTPPIKTDYGWLMLYHATGPDSHYRLGAMMMGLDDPTKILYRTRDWIMQPEREYEIKGFYNGCVFPCGKVIIGDTLFVYYGAADKYVGLATCPVKDLIDYLLECPCDDGLEFGSPKKSISIATVLDKTKKKPSKQVVENRL